MVAALRTFSCRSNLGSDARSDRKSLAWPSLAQRFVLRILVKSRQAVACRRPEIACSRLLTVCVILCSLSFAGCARNPAQRKSVRPCTKAKRLRSAPPHAPADTPEPVRYAEPKIRRPDLALLSPQPAPDCEFKRSDLKTIDPDEWARLKVEFERQCYQDAEKAARERLVLLQASSTCEIEPVPHPKPAPLAFPSIATSQVLTQPGVSGAPIRARLQRAFRELYVI